PPAPAPNATDGSGPPRSPLTAAPLQDASAGAQVVPVTNRVSEPPAPPALANGYNLPLAFEPKVGQTDSRVQFLARGPGYGLFLTGDGAVLSPAQPGSPGQRDVVQLRFTGAN